MSLAADDLGFDPLGTDCRNCWAKAGESCNWSSPPPDPPFHAERIEDAQFAAACAAQLDGTAPNQKHWQDALKTAAEELV